MCEEGFGGATEDMPIPSLIGAVVALATRRWSPLLWAVVADVVIVTLLVRAFKWFFRGVHIDPQQVEKHLAFYSPSADQDEVRDAPHWRAGFVRGLTTFGAAGEEKGAAARLQDRGAQLLQLCHADLPQDLEPALQHGHRWVALLSFCSILTCRWQVFPTEDRSHWMNYPQAQSVYQCFLALKLGMREFEEAGDVYGDFGCGVGGPTRMIAQFSGAKIVAVNINKMHLEYLAKYNEEVRQQQLFPFCLV